MTVLAGRSDRVSPTLPTSTSAPTVGHLRQIDVARVLTFVCVIAVHAISHTNGTSRSAAEAGMLLHFTREAFFAITGFVLFHTQWGKPLHARRFLWRRCSLVLIPLLTWTLVYFEYNRTEWPVTAEWWRHFGYIFLTGTGEYHLYFLVVTVQIYLFFPLLRWLVRATQGHHGWLFGGALAFELAATWAMHGPGQHATGFAGQIMKYAYELFPSYVFYVIAGALAAVHLTRWQQLVDRRRFAVLWFLAVAAAATLWVEQAQTHAVQDIGHATDVLQPIMVVWSVAVAIALYALGSAWISRRPSTRAIALLDEATFISFGVYLIHPLFLQIFSDHWLGLGNSWITAPASTLLLIAVTVVTSVLAVEILCRTPLSLAFTGRKAKKPRRRTAASA